MCRDGDSRNLAWSCVCVCVDIFTKITQKLHLDFNLIVIKYTLSVQGIK